MIKSDITEKNVGGRPTKLDEELLDKLKNLLDNPASIVLTDEDICIYLNIDKQTKNNWLNAEYKDEMKERFFALIKRARVIQKQNLANQLQIGENGWQAKAWLLERKCNDLNLKNISEVKQTNINTDVSLDQLLEIANKE